MWSASRTSPTKQSLSHSPVKPNFRSFVQFAVAAQPKFYVSFPGLRGSKILINLIWNFRRWKLPEPKHSRVCRQGSPTRGRMEVLVPFWLSSILKLHGRLGVFWVFFRFFELWARFWTRVCLLRGAGDKARSVSRKIIANALAFNLFCV